MSTRPKRPSRAVVDTNILVSALLSPAGPPGAVAQAIRHGALQPVVCAGIIKEYVDVLHRSRLNLEPHKVEELVALIEAQAQWVRVPQYQSAKNLPDPDDWPFIAAAIAADCPVITGNMRHFPKALGVKSVTAREWVESGG